MWPQPSSDLPTTPTTNSDKICDHSRGSKDSDSTDTWPHSQEETERSFNSSFDDLSDAFTSKSIRKRCSPSTDTISPAKCESLSSRPRNGAEVIGLNSSYQHCLFKELEQYIRETGRALPRSNHPREVVQVVSKYIYFAHGGQAVETASDYRYLATQRRGNGKKFQQ